jgi:hypothetical protein
MGKLRYKSVIPHNKPMWLLKLQFLISQEYDDVELENNAVELEKIDSFIRKSIHSLIDSRDVCRSVVETEVRSDDGRTVLFIFRNGRLLQTYYIQD